MTLKTPHYRIDDPATGLAVQFRCLPAPPGEAPRVAARLVNPACATTFMSHRHAAECFARFVQGQPLDIVRCDA